MKCWINGEGIDVKCKSFRIFRNAENMKHNMCQVFINCNKHLSTEEREQLSKIIIDRINKE